MEFNNFLTETGRVNSMKLKESWLIKHAPTFWEDVKHRMISLNITYDKPAEAIWNYFNGSTEQVICKNNSCTSQTKFLGLLSGYSGYCSYSCSNSSDEVKNKKINTSLIKYGVSNPYQSKEIIKKIKETNINRYGADNPMRSSAIKNKMVERSIEKTGKKWSLSKGGIADVTKRKNAKDRFINKYPNLQLLEYSDEKFGECSFLRESCGHSFSINKWQLHQRTSQGVDECTVCNPIGSFTETIWQNEIAEFLGELGVKFKERDRSILGNLELDFYIPKLNIAIELNGLYWHSISFKNPQYHLNKTERCEALGIQIIHVFEDEWKYKKNVVLSRIKNILHLSETRIYARHCKVRQVSGKVAKEFIDANHLQGSIPASKRFGLFYNDELVAVMTFGALRRALGSSPVDGVYEMYRFCNKINYLIIGGAGKLLKAFISSENPTEIISYADRRWSTGNLYLSLGFSLVKKTSPNFWYIEADRRVHRFNYTSKKLKEMPDKIEPSRIYDSGNLKFSLTILET